MDSKLYGVPLSTTQATPSPPPAKVPFSGIRAPLTIDSDFEFEQSSDQKDSVFYFYSSESEGFLSGEDEFETASERPIVNLPDGRNTFQRSSNVGGYNVFRPFANPNDNIEENNNIGDDIDSKPDVESVEDNFGVKKTGNFRPAVRDTNLEFLGSPVEMEIEYASINDEISFVPKPTMPIAQVSGDSDDDGSVLSEVLEDDGVSGVVRIPDGVLERFNSLPKFRLLEVEEEDPDLQSKTFFVSQSGKDSIMAETVNEVLSPEDKEQHIMMDTVYANESAEAVEDNIFDISGRASHEFSQLSEGSHFVAKHSAEEIETQHDDISGSVSHEYSSEPGSHVVAKHSAKEIETQHDDNSGSVSHEYSQLSETGSYFVAKHSAEEIETKHDDFSGSASHASYSHLSEPGSHTVDNLSAEEIEAQHDDIEKRQSVQANGTIEESEDSNFPGTDTSVNQVKEQEFPYGSAELNLMDLDSKVPEVQAVFNFEISPMDDGTGTDNNLDASGDGKSGQDSDIGKEKSGNVQQRDTMIEPSENLAARESLPFDGSDRENEKPCIDQAKSSENPAPEDLLHSAEEHSTQNYIMADEAGYGSVKLFEEVESFICDESQCSIFNDSDTVEQVMEHSSQRSIPASFSVDEISEDHIELDGQITTDSDEEVEREVISRGEDIFDSSALAAFLKTATNMGSDGSGISLLSSNGTRIYPLEHPVGLGSAYLPLRPSTQPGHPISESEAILSEEAKKKLEKLQQIRVKYLRLLQRLNLSVECPTAAQVLYKLVLAAGRNPVQEFDLDSAKREAMELEADGKYDINFSMNILVIGKSGVGKSATINSIFGEKIAPVNAFEPTTTHVKEITGTVDGVRIRVLDTPGLRSSLAEQSQNRKILLSIKKFTKKFSPHVVLYVDRLDSQARDLNDLPLLKSITKYLGSAIWRSVVVTLTHGASAPPDGPYGYPSSYEMFIAQRSRVLQQLINLSVSDVNLFTPGPLSPVSVVENNYMFQVSENNKTLLPNGENWRSQLLLLCYSTVILSEIASVVNAQDGSEHRNLFAFRRRSPPLLYFLSSLLQTIVHPKLSTDKGVENGDSDTELGYSSESDQDEEDEYDQLPPFKPLRKSQIANLSKDQRKAYFEEYDYRVKLLQRKQLREVAKRIQGIKKGKDDTDNYGYTEEEGDQEDGNPSSIAVPLPDMVLPPSFDGDNPAYRYRFLEPSSQLLTRPVLDSHGWDHDCGYDGVSIEDSLAVAGQYPAIIVVQLTKDKKEFNIHLNSSVSVHHGEKGSTMAGFDIQTVGKQLAYILKSEYKIKNYRINKTAAGLSITFLGENMVTGIKLSDQITVGKRLALAANTGISYSQGDAAYGANVEVRLRERDYPIGQDQSTLSLSVMKWRGDHIWGCNLQSEFSVARNSKLAVRAGLNNKMSGQISVRTSSSDQLQIAMLALVPIAKAIFRKIFQSGGTQ